MIGRRAKWSCSSKGRRRPSPVLLLKLNVADALNSSGNGILCCSSRFDDTLLPVLVVFMLFLLDVLRYLNGNF
eukprot:UN13250